MEKLTDREFERTKVVIALYHSSYSTEVLEDILKNPIKYKAQYKEPVVSKETKICSRCKREVPLDYFFKNKLSPDGLQAVCKGCYKELYK